MKCRVKAFGISRDIIGNSFLEIEIPENYPVADFKKDLFLRFPDLVNLRSLYVAVNNEYADEQSTLKAGDEIALIPPVSGG